MKETWKDIPGYEGLYQASNQGRIKSLPREWMTGRHKHKIEHGEIILKPSKDKRGYLRVTLQHNGRKFYLLHRLVLQAFVGESNLDCNHRNGIKSDNRLENLEWCTKSENQKHACRIGLANQKGENNAASKLKNWDVKIIRKLYKNTKYWDEKQLAKLFKVNIGTIRNIVNNRSWVEIL